MTEKEKRQSLIQRATRKTRFNVSERLLCEMLAKANGTNREDLIVSSTCRAVIGAEVMSKEMGIDLDLDVEKFRDMEAVHHAIRNAQPVPFFTKGFKRRVCYRWVVDWPPMNVDTPEENYERYILPWLPVTHINQLERTMKIPEEFAGDPYRYFFAVSEVLTENGVRQLLNWFYQWAVPECTEAVMRIAGTPLVSEETLKDVERNLHRNRGEED